MMSKFNKGERAQKVPAQGSEDKNAFNNDLSHVETQQQAEK